MKLHQFVASLSSKLDKAKVLEDVDVTIQQLNDYTLPVYTSSISANVLTTSTGFKSLWLQKRNREFTAMAKTGLRGNVIEQTAQLLGRCQQRLEWIRGQLESQADVRADGLSYPTALLLQLYEATRFYITYARKFLLLGYAYEAKAVGMDTTDSFPFTKAEILEIEQQYADFIRITNVFAKHGSNIPKLINTVPDITVDVTGTKGTAGLMGEAKLDPLRFNFGAHRWNPIWWYQSWRAEAQHQRYEASKTERQAIEMRILQMKMAQNGQVDAAIEKAIAYHEQRVKDLNYKIAKWEAEYAG